MFYVVICFFVFFIFCFFKNTTKHHYPDGTIKHDEDFFFDDAFYEDFHKKNNPPQKNPQSLSPPPQQPQPTTNNNNHNKIQDQQSQSQSPPPQQPQPQPQSQSQSQPKPKPKITPDYKKLLQSIRDYEIKEEEQQQESQQKSQPQQTTNNKHHIDHQGQYFEPMVTTPPPISNPTIATTSTAATAPVISTAATCINSGAVKNPQPSPPEDEAIRRLNERLELYQLENSRVIPGDGNCQMYALSDQLYGDLKHSFEIRRAIATWLIKNKNLTLKNGAKISQFANTTNWNKYCNQMARRGTWGDHLTLIAAAEVYKSKITIISSIESNSSFFIEIVPSSIENDRAIILSHHAEEHYGSISLLSYYALTSVYKFRKSNVVGSSSGSSSDLGGKANAVSSGVISISNSCGTSNVKYIEL
ncbi:hypothetical protein DICPUDRAFT_78170 [Dictyostelium purpureum]|uniref:OTU domain-containing protein n=1 Tax=Dictyostelium purpureum TaxID=5786 RepID=F0ZIR9_DICPU|nr:uncharacterized protein DICPUDRAFT_78170 [Dictyostelium purpureum]EGC36182.1 hypothetical protein DICPUDRAFT_78170 [Dictyostelium purpureum]|eukprot:XP_003287315.1 hypothetical protein DICPUDRAFT_78170 [Dictyostelium purpureum]